MAKSRLKVLLFYTMSRKILFSTIFIPIFITLVFFTSVFLNKNPGFDVDKSKNGLWVCEIFDNQLNGVQTGDLIVAINTIPFAKVLGQLIHQERHWRGSQCSSAIPQYWHKIKIAQQSVKQYNQW